MDQLAQALSKAQLKIKAPLKNKKVDYTHNGKRTKYSYADLADVIEAVKVPLSEVGLAVIHTIGFIDGIFGLKTVLLHTSGQSIDSFYPLPNPAHQEIKAQEFGSHLTYARRYSLSAIVGIASEEDDDGQIAAPIPKTAPKSPPKTPQSPIAKPKNFAPIKPPPDVLPDYEGPIFDQEPEPEPPPDPVFDHPLDELLWLRNQKGLSNDDMSQTIFRVVGEQKRAKDLSPAELQRVINYVRKFK
jgi:hypothetical protein